MSFQCHCPSEGWPGVGVIATGSRLACLHLSTPSTPCPPTVLGQSCHILSLCSQGHPLTAYFVTTSINNHNSQWDWWLIIAVITHLSVGDKFDRQLGCQCILCTQSNLGLKVGFRDFILSCLMRHDNRSHYLFIVITHEWQLDCVYMFSLLTPLSYR